LRFNNKSLGFLWHNYVTIFEATRMRDIQKIQITSKNSGSRRPAGGSHLHRNLVSWSTDHDVQINQWEKLWDLWDPQRRLDKLRELFVRLRIDGWPGLLWIEEIGNHERERTCKISVGISHHQTKHWSDLQAASACPASGRWGGQFDRVTRSRKGFRNRSRRRTTQVLIHVFIKAKSVKQEPEVLSRFQAVVN